MATAARESSQKGPPEPPKLSFEVQCPGLPSRNIELRQDIIKIGKLSSSHIQVQDSAVSRVHAVIEVTPQGEIFVIDLGSSNGTYVNGRRVSKERLRNGDELTVGQTRLKLTFEGEASTTAPDAMAAETTPPPAPQPTAAAAEMAPPPPPQVPVEPAPPPPEVEARPAEVVAPEPPGYTPGPVQVDLFAAATLSTQPEPPLRAAPAPAAPPSAVAAPVAASVAVPIAAPTPEPEPVRPAPEVRPVAETRPPASVSVPEVKAVAYQEPRRPPPPAPSFEGIERRFLAITAAEPLTTDVAGIVEARLAFGRDIIEARTFEATTKRALPKLASEKRWRKAAYRHAQDVTVGPLLTCDFMVDGFNEPFALLRATEEGFVLRFHADDLGRVRLGDQDFSFSSLAKHRETTTADDDPRVYEWPFRRGALASLKVGGTVLYLRSVPKAPPPPIRYLETRDPKLLLAFLGVFVFSGALMWRAVTWPPLPAVLLEDRNKLDERLVSFLVNPEERERRAKIYGVKEKEKEDKTAVKGTETKNGTEKPTRDKRRVATEEKQQLTPEQQRERDLKRVRRLGALQAIEKDAVLKEIFAGTGSGSGGFGRGPGGGIGDGTAEWSGMTDGEGGGYGGWGGMGFGGGDGTGGGGVGRYVGVGRLGTRGIGGGRGGGSRFGAGEARFKEHTTEQPKVTVGEPEVGGGLTKEIIRRVIRSHIHEIRYCYERELSKDPNLYGKIVVKFTILPSGNVHQAGIKSSTMGNENVESCILARVARWTFPKPYKGASVIVSYPFLFKAAGRDE